MVRSRKHLRMCRLYSQGELNLQLTRYTDYGLRTLIYLALLPDGKRANIDEISVTYDISRNNVNKIVHHLGKAGVIETKRGKGGGFALRMAPEQINLAEMVRLLENSVEVVECHKPACKILPACKLKGALAQATQAFFEVLAGFTLADLLAGKEDSLVQILELN